MMRVVWSQMMMDGNMQHDGGSSRNSIMLSEISNGNFSTKLSSKYRCPCFQNISKAINVFTTYKVVLSVVALSLHPSRKKVTVSKQDERETTHQVNDGNTICSKLNWCTFK